MSEIILMPGDNRVRLRELIDAGVQVHSVVTDPPYGISFMGKGWDSTMIERDPEFWKLIWEILLPGGYVFAFSGSRTGHWQACAMEMAGFVMHPMHGWVFGTGFPKAHNASRAIDAHLTLGKSNPRAAKEINKLRPGEMRETATLPNNGIMSGDRMGGLTNDNPLTPEATQWEGWGYGTQAQKPALEPIYLGQKPFSEKTGAANILKHGVGAVNIDGCRVPTEGEIVTTHSRGGSTASPSRPTERTVEESGRSTRQDLIDPNPREGRHPSNLILDGSPEVVAMFPNTAAGKRSNRGIDTAIQGGNYANGGKAAVRPDKISGHDDNGGSAARFFHQFTPDADPLFYHPKAGKADRAGSKHPTVKPIALMQYLVRHITPPGGTILDPFAGSGTTGEAARREGFDCILMEMTPEYIDFLKERFTNREGIEFTCMEASEDVQ